MRPLAWIAIVVFALLLLVPTSQMRFHFTHEADLRGVTLEARRPAVTAAGWWSGKFQKDFEAWFDEKLGFRAHFIKLDNQIGYSLFHEASSKAVDKPVVGLKGFVYEDAYVEALNGSPIPPDADLAALAHRLRLLQDAMDRQGIPYVFVISPSKAAIYPEFVPARFLQPVSRRLPTTYARFLPQLQREGVRFVDGHAILAEQRRRSPALLYTPGGIHWNRYGAYFVVREIWRRFAAATPRPLVGLRCDSLALDPLPVSGGRDDEKDIEHMLNVVKVRSGGWKFPHPLLATDSTAQSFRPRLMLVGDSFGWMLTRIFTQQRMTSVLDYYYYFKHHLRFTDAHPAAIEVARQPHDWEQDLTAADAVLLEVNEIQIDSTGCGFVERAAAKLAGRAPRLAVTSLPVRAR